MSDNGARRFNASKPSRNSAFSVPQNPAGTVDPMPATLGTRQKVGQPSSGADTVTYQGTPFGSDKNNKTHVQPAGPVNRGGLPGEQEDPRLC